MDGRRKLPLIVLVCLAAAAGAVSAVVFFGVPVRSVLFFSMIAVCPLMHLFMGHGAHGHHGATETVAHPEPTGDDR